MNQVKVEERLTALEQAVRALKESMNTRATAPDWLDRVIGSVKDEPAFDEVLVYGQASVKPTVPLSKNRNEIFAVYNSLKQNCKTIEWLMKRRPNRQRERAGVNAARALFERVGYVFQEVDGANDYGKDAYIDMANGETISGICVALQIKSGNKYKRVNHYRIPVERHLNVWKKSTVPIAGIVFDSDLSKLFWCDITSTLNADANLTAEIRVDSSNELTDISVIEEFEPHFRELALLNAAQQAVLRLCSNDPEVRRIAMLDCFAYGRSDARVLIIL